MSVEGAAGFFDQFSGALYAPLIEAWPAPFTDTNWLRLVEDQLAIIANTDERYNRALELTVLYHEERHFHDCFMTPVGVQLFEDYVRAFSQLGKLVLSKRDPTMGVDLLE
jgi:hypothetical protein